MGADDASGYRTKKRFGQHFLHERKFIDDILSAAAIRPHETVLEVGPGLGALTDRLLPLASRVEVIELDRDLVARLRERDDPRLVLHAGDALALDWPAVLTRPPYVCVANLPYNIASQVLFKLIDHRELFDRAVLMFQKEVGDRICADPGSRDYGILSAISRMHFDVRRVVTVPPGAFRPPPKVESVVLHFQPLARPRFDLDDEPFWRRVVRAAFGQRRKTLLNTLKAHGFDADAVREACVASGVDPARRGETLGLDEFAALANRLNAMRPDPETSPKEKTKR